LGKKIIEYLYEHFEELFRYEFTREMELDLDKIEKSEISLQYICDKCNKLLDNSIENIDFSLVKREKIENNQITNKNNLGRYEDKDIILKKGKYGLYVNWKNNNISLKKHFGNRPVENIRLEEVIPYIREKK
jgi:hypothetical protein